MYHQLNHVDSSTNSSRVLRVFLVAEQKRRILGFLKVFTLALVVFYFSYHILSGDKGLLTMIRLMQELDAAHKKGDEVKAERAQLEHRVSMMGSNSLDSDLLDEQARRLLGYAGKKEIVYFDSPK